MGLLLGTLELIARNKLSCKDSHFLGDTGATVSLNATGIFLTPSQPLYSLTASVLACLTESSSLVFSRLKVYEQQNKLQAALSPPPAPVQHPSEATFLLRLPHCFLDSKPQVSTPWPSDLSWLCLPQLTECSLPTSTQGSKQPPDEQEALTQVSVSPTPPGSVLTGKALYLKGQRLPGEEGDVERSALSISVQLPP